MRFNHYVGVFALGSFWRRKLKRCIWEQYVRKNVTHIFEI